MTLCTKIDSMGTENKRSSDKPRCSFCYKGGHDASRCFKHVSNVTEQDTLRNSVQINLQQGQFRTMLSPRRELC